MDKLFDSISSLIPVRHSHEKDKHDARAILEETYGKFSAIMVDKGKSLTMKRRDRYLFHGITKSVIINS